MDANTGRIFPSVAAALLAGQCFDEGGSALEWASLDFDGESLLPFEEPAGEGAGAKAGGGEVTGGCTGGAPLCGGDGSLAGDGWAGGAVAS